MAGSKAFRKSSITMTFHSLTRLDGVYCVVSPKGEVLSMHLTLKEADEAGAKINGPIQIEMGKWT